MTEMPTNGAFGMAREIFGKVVILQRKKPNLQGETILVKPLSGKGVEGEGFPSVKG